LTLTPESHSLLSTSEIQLKTTPIFSSNGSFVAYLTHDLITIHSTHSGEIFSQISCPDVENLEFNPSGTFLTTWSRPTRAAVSGASKENFRVWDVATSTVIGSYNQRTYRKGLLQWLNQENDLSISTMTTALAPPTCLRLVTNEIHQIVVLPTTRTEELSVSTAFPLTLVRVSKFHHPNVTQFSISPRVSSTEVSVALFTPEHSGKTARVSLVRFNPQLTDPTTTAESFVSTGISRSLFRYPLPTTLTAS
jgi:uncharacterized protein with WD repeat